MATTETNSNQRNGSSKQIKAATDRRQIVRQEIVAIALALFAVLFALCLFSFSPNDASFNVAAGRGASTRNLVGTIGAWIAGVLLQSLGVVAYLVPLVLLFAAWRVFRAKGLRAPVSRIIGLLAITIAFAALVALFTTRPLLDGSYLPGGLIGASISTALASILNTTGAATVLVALAALGLLLGTNFSFTRAYELLSTDERLSFLRSIPEKFRRSRERRQTQATERAEAKQQSQLESEQQKTEPIDARAKELHPSHITSSGREKTAAERVADFMRETAAPDQSSTNVGNIALQRAATVDKVATTNNDTAQLNRDIVAKNLAFSSGASLITPDAQHVVNERSQTKKESTRIESNVAVDDRDEIEEMVRDASVVRTETADEKFANDLETNTHATKQTAAALPTSNREYRLPPAEFLTEAPPRREQADEELLDLATRVAEKCREFNVNGQIKHICPGPVVTTYEFKPDAGVKYSRVTGLVDDLCLALKAESIRIDRLPGKPHVGIEVPNPERETIFMREVVESRAYRDSASKLTLALGKTIDGMNYVADLAKMPHLLIAGATGTGKSVCLNSLIVSMLYKATPDEVKFIMVDPKRLELGLYADIPHLATPIITEPKRAANALKWAVKTMEERYKELAKWGVRNIDGYNAEVLRRNTVEEFDENGNQWKPLPYIVIIIDELADLMMVSGHEVEEAITRLAQMARAVGIHLVLATQRPSVDVITGLIKANFPSRISFRVSSKVDSRTILDTNGSEQLLGRGDMLFLPPGTSRLVRVHGAYLDETETNKIVSFIKAQGKPEYDTTITQSEEEQAGANGLPGEHDELFDQALRICVEMKRASTSVLQRRLRIGYGRAAAILDQMERESLIGQADGARPRPVLGSAYETVAHWDEIVEEQ